MMAVEQPLIASLIARLEAPAVHLAAFGVAFAVALIFEAPIIMLLSAATALIRDQHSYRKLFLFTLILNAFITLAISFACIPSIFNWLSDDVLKLPPTIRSFTHISLIILIPWPAAIGFRRFFQGVLIVSNRTNQVALGTVSRITFMGTTAIVLYLFGTPGAITGASALAVGVTVECIATWWMAKESAAQFKKIPPDPGSALLSLSSISRFYYPLALTSFLSLGVQPITTFFIGKGRYPLESLAVLPVINALVFLFRSLGLSFQEVAITYVRRTQEITRKIMHFAWFLGLFVFIGMAVLALTPISQLWFVNVSGLDPELAAFALDPTRILILLPSLTVLISFQRAVLVKAKATGAITVSSVIELSLIVLSIWVLIVKLNWIGATAAASAFMLGRLGANMYLWPQVKKNLYN